MKRGEFGFHLNWIYVMIVGIVILIAAGGIITSIRSSAESDLLTNVIYYVDNILKNIQLNTNAESMVHLPKADVLFDCETLTVESTQSSSIPLTDNIVFSPDRIKKDLLGYSRNWYMPFDAEFFSYVTSPGAKYVFLDSPSSKKLYDALPLNINKVLITKAQSFSDEKPYKLRYITFDYIPDLKKTGDFAWIDDKDVSLIKIELLEDIDNFPDTFGKATFYRKKGNNFAVDKAAYFFDRASLIGVVYSEDATRYECNMEKAIEKLGIIASLKKDKLKSYSENPLYPFCPYERGNVALNDLSVLTAKKSYDYDSLHAIYLQSKIVKEENRLLQRLSCPLIY